MRFRCLKQVEIRFQVLLRQCGGLWRLLRVGRRLQNVEKDLDRTWTRGIVGAELRRAFVTCRQISQTRHSSSRCHGRRFVRSFFARCRAGSAGASVTKVQFRQTQKGAFLDTSSLALIGPPSDSNFPDSRPV